MKYRVHLLSGRSYIVNEKAFTRLSHMANLRVVFDNEETGMKSVIRNAQVEAIDEIPAQGGGGDQLAAMGVTVSESPHEVGTVVEQIPEAPVQKADTGSGSLDYGVDQMPIMELKKVFYDKKGGKDGDVPWNDIQKMRKNEILLKLRGM